MENIVGELGVPRRYLKIIDNNRFLAYVHKTWLKSLIKHSKLIEFVEKSDKQVIWSEDDHSNLFWEHVLIQEFKKCDVKVLPLPRRRNADPHDSPLLLVQLLQYISRENHKNLNKSAQNKCYNGIKTNKEKQVTLVSYNEVLKDTISRIYGCPIINICETPLNTKLSNEFEVHLNILPSICCVETLNSFFLLHIPYIEYTLNDCINFSPAILDKCFTKPLFIVYQLLQAFKSVHERSLTMGCISLRDIFITEDLWLYILPQITSNIHTQNEKDLIKQENQYDCLKKGHKFNEQFKCETCFILAYDKVQVTNENLEELCQLWISGNISNFTYITALNNFSGRKVGDPNCHHVFPWVTDFASRCGKNWRDLKKSKYRLNKGDRQLDLTYENCQTKVSHHVSDVLSEITYYVYMARRTPKTVLCRNVRTVWVPAEYPSSIQRMQEWTPDECIPEFFSDPTIFKSIHKDLGDLEVPPWSTGPEDFIRRHRETLESQHVSERLHHWIDLTFGFKLSGNAAVKAKNVCLHLADEHTNLMKSGVVQLFNYPHPQRGSVAHLVPSLPFKPYFQKIPRQRTRDRSHSSVEVERSRTVEEYSDDSSPLHTTRSSLGFTRFLSQSRTSLNDEIDHKSSRSPSRSSSVGPKTSSFTSHVSSRPKTYSTSVGTNFISLPKDYRPESALDLLEKRHLFFAKTFFSEPKKPIVLQLEPEEMPKSSMLQNSFTNFMFSEQFHYGSKSCKQQIPVKKNDSVFCNYAEVITNYRVRELQVLGCLIVEIFYPRRLQPLSINKRNGVFSERFSACVSVLRKCAKEFPPCVVSIAKLLLQPEISDLKQFSYPVVTEMGLPRPNVHLLLEPVIHYNLHFSKHFPALYKLLSMLKNFDNISKEISILFHFDCKGVKCSEYENLERTKFLLVQNVAECKVKTCAKLATAIFEELDTTTDVQVINIILPYIKQLIEEPSSSVLASWYLFDPMARVLGPQRTTSTLMESILKLYDSEPSECTISFHGRIAKLYHHSFLLRLMVRLGLKNFLDNFAAPIVEAVGRYRDCEKIDFVPHSHHEKIARKASLLHTFDSESNNTFPSDNLNNTLDTSEISSEPEIFDFEEEKPDETQLKSLIQHLELNVSSDLPLNHSIADDALDVEPLNISGVGINVTTDYDDNSDSNDNHKSFEIFNVNTNISTSYEAKISDISADSLIWLAHRLGPVLTARYLSRNLLKMLTLCYIGKDNLVASDGRYYHNDIISIASSQVVGDQTAAKVLECLGNIAGLYGEQFILFQYVPHMSELIALCKRKITPNFEGGLISCLALLIYVIPYLSDSTLMDQLQDNILKNVIHPIVRLLGSTKYTFPSGHIARGVLAKKYLDAIYVLSIRVGSDMTRTHLAVPALQKFFMIFEKLHTNCSQKENDNSSSDLELNRDATSTEWNIINEDRTIQTINVRLRDSEASSSVLSTDVQKEPNSIDSANVEIQAVFTPLMAYTAYMPFVKYLGMSFLENSLKNIDTIKDLCKEYKNTVQTIPSREKPNVSQGDHVSTTPTMKHSGSIGSNVAVIGNRIEVQGDVQESSNCDLLNLVSNKIENNNRHLRGNWFAYWGHEIGRSDKDSMFSLKQIKLQTFSGHAHSVKCLHTLDNENSFMSGSRDKTVKLWSLRSQGDGSSISNCQWTYTAHKKSVLALTFIENMRLVASCDSNVHIWDPFMGVNVSLLESPKYAPVNTMKSMPAPSCLVYAATTDGTLKAIDTRLCSYVFELKVNANPSSLIRCLAISPSGLWIAAGQSSGNIVVLDTRTGLIISSWRAHESEILQLVAVNNDTLVSSSFDQTISVWNIPDGKFQFHMGGSTEPVHCLSVYKSELISGSTANRIGIHTSVDADASFSSTKLRSDALRGLLTSMALLPLNRLLLLGADTGNISLLC